THTYCHLLVCLRSPLLASILSPPPSLYSILLSFPSPPRYLHSFPTRRSSDLYLFSRADSKLLVELHNDFTLRYFPRRLPLETWLDRKSTRLNSSHGSISYAVFCLKKKTTKADAQ